MAVRHDQWKSGINVCKESRAKENNTSKYSATHQKTEEVPGVAKIIPIT